MKTKPQYWYKQSAVIPYRNVDKGIEVLVISSRKKKKWIFPKGIVEENLSPRESSIKEAFEEAGIKGNLLSEKIGKYAYKKWGGKCKVNVYALNVDTVFDKWEEDFRERKWVNLVEIQNYIKNENIIEITNRLTFIISNNT